MFLCEFCGVVYQFNIFFNFMTICHRIKFSFLSQCERCVYLSLLHCSCKVHRLAVYCGVVFHQNLFYLSSDEDSDVRKNVCRALVMLIEVRMDRLMPHINNLVEVGMN